MRNSRFRQWTWAILATVTATFSLVLSLEWAIAGHGLGLHCCRQCGCNDHEVVCRLIREDKKVTITCWGCKNEDFCLPGPSERDCKNCEEVCEPSKDPKSPGSCPKKFVWYSWTPSPCGKVYTKQKLMKRTVTKTLPSYKWVVEELCPQCQTNLTPVEATPTAEIPPAPTIPGAKVIGPVELTNAKAELLY